MKQSARFFKRARFRERERGEKAEGNFEEFFFFFCTSSAFQVTKSKGRSFTNKSFEEDQDSGVMRGYLDKTLLAANTDLAVAPKLNINNDVFLENFHLEFTTAASTTPRSFDDESLAAEKNQIDEEMCFAILIVFLFGIGVFINIGCLASLRRHRSTFHRFLKMLACFDALVVTCIFLMYALPVLAPWYKKTIFLPMVPFFLPVVHMALMGSVYSTIVMSLERYLRLCRVQTMSKRCGTIWCVIVVIFPAVFYFPKFFEYRYQKFEHDFPIPINCSKFVLEQRELQELDNAIQWVSFYKLGLSNG